MNTPDYENLSDDLKNAISSLATALWNPVNADSILIHSMESGGQRPSFATLLIYYLKNRAPDYFTVAHNTNPYKMMNYRINSKDVSAWSVDGGTKSSKGNSFTEDTKIFLSVKDPNERLSNGWILIVNKKDGVFLSLSALNLKALRNGESYFKNEYIREKLMVWGGSPPTPQGWGIKYLYDITDYIVEFIDNDFINWPLNFPMGLI
jgi:hypothetical protein